MKNHTIDKFSEDHGRKADGKKADDGNCHVGGAWQRRYWGRWGGSPSENMIMYDNVKHVYVKLFHLKSIVYKSVTTSNRRTEKFAETRHVEL